MKRVLDADKRCDTERLLLSSLTYRFVPPVVLSLGHRSYTHGIYFWVVLCACFYFGGVVHKNIWIFWDFGIK